ncbi:MAG: ferric reductase-like transmembrane domain-containing protein [Geminicoccaceae bacterium]|nr:ferric reductase-like transmembrane domain-containing protein [Geminicoccaceae bacterium]
MSTLKSVWNSPYTFWLLLALPSIGMITDGITGAASFHRLVHPTGEFAARFTIIAMAITPLMLLLGRQRWLLWLMARRRHLGVAAFGYAALHTLYYLLDKASLDIIMAELARAGIWTGWFAFLIFVPLAITSNDTSMRRMRKLWKSLQRWVYPAAVLTLVHWLLVSRGIGGAVVHFAPLAALEAYRIWHVTTRQSRRLAQAQAEAQTQAQAQA